MKKRHCTNNIRANIAKELKKQTNIKYRYDAYAALTDLEVLSGNVTKPQTKEVIRKIRSESRANNTIMPNQTYEKMYQCIECIQRQ